MTTLYTHTFIRCVLGLLALVAASVAQAQTTPVATSFQVSCTNTSVAETSGTVALSCSMARTGSYTGNVDWAVTHVTTSDADFPTNGTSGTANVSGATTNFTVSIAGDSVVENDETFTLNAVASTTNNVSAGTAVTITITDTDTAAIQVTLGPLERAETDSNINVTYTIGFLLGASASFPVTVTWIISGSEVEAADFTGVTADPNAANRYIGDATVAFAAGDTSNTFTLTIAGDNVREGDEQFSITADVIGNNRITPATGRTVVISDDDDDLHFTLNAPTAATAEGATPAWTITYLAQDGAMSSLQAMRTLNVRVFNNRPSNDDQRSWRDDWVATPDIATDTRFVSSVTDGQRETNNVAYLSFPVVIPGLTPHNTPVPIANMPMVADDDIVEPVEHYTVQVGWGGSRPMGGTITGSPAAGTIAASDPIMLTVVAPAGRLITTEGNTTTNGVRVNFAGVVGGDDPWVRPNPSNTDAIRIAYTTDGTARESGDIPWSEVRRDGYATLYFGGTDDSNVEAHRAYDAVIVTGVNAPGFYATAAANSFAVTVRDNDPQAWVVAAVDHLGRIKQDVQEDADTYAPATPNAPGDADDGYFRIFDVINVNTRAATDITYCIYGTARGGVASDDSRDFTWPNGYDPNADVSHINPLCTAGSGVLRLPAGAAPRQRIPLDIHNDTLNEGDETINIDTVLVVSDEGYPNVVSHHFYTGDNSFATRTIKDNDPITVSIAAVPNQDTSPDSGLQIPEGRAARFTVTLSTASASAARVPYQFSTNQGNNGDFQDPGGGSLTIPAGETSGIIRIPLLVNAGDGSTPEEVSIILSTGGYSAAGSISRTTTGNQSVVFFIADPNPADAQVLSLTRYATAAHRTAGTPAATADITEGDAGGDVTLYYSVTTSAAFTTAAMVTWTVHPLGGNGTDAGDFTGATTGTVTMTGSTAADFDVTVAGDAINEATERFIVRLTTEATGTATGTAVSAANITDNDDIVYSIAVTSPDASAFPDHQASEGRTLVFTISLDHASQSEVTVPFTLSADHDVAAADYTTFASSPLRIPAGDTSGTLSYFLLEDADSVNEEFTIILDATGATAAGTIARSATVGEQAATTSVVTRTDDRTLTLERFTDPARTAASTGSVTEGDDGNTTFYYRIAVPMGDTDFTNPTAVMWSVTHGSTTAADFSGPISGSVMMTNSGDFAITIVGDNFNEANEGFTVSLSVADVTADGGTNADAMDSVTITDDDPIVITLTASGGGMVAEADGAMATVNISLSAIPTQALNMIFLQDNDGNIADDGDDYEDVGAGDSDFFTGTRTVTIAANANPPTSSITIAITNDTVNEPAEDFLMVIDEVTGWLGTEPMRPEVEFIIPANDPVTATIAAPTPATVNEGQAVTFTVTLSDATVLDSALTVTYTATGLVDGNGAAVMPEVASGSTLGMLVIPAGAVDDDGYALALTIPRNNDRNDGQSDPLTVTITGVTGGGGGSAAAAPGNAAMVTANYLSAAHIFALSGNTAMPEGGGAVTYTVTRTGPAITGTNIIVSWTYTAGTAAAADFSGGTVPAGGMLTFTGTDTTQTFTVTPADDSLNEAGETFDLGLSAAPAVLTAEGGVGLGSALTVTITDDDTVMVAITADASTVNESNNAAVDFTVTLSGGTRTAAVMVPFTVSGLDNEEYRIDFPISPATATGGTITFAATGTSPTATIELALTGDDSVNESESIVITGGTATSAGAVAYTSGGESASTAIVDNDPLFAHLIAAAPGATVNEGSAHTFTVSLHTSDTANPGPTNTGTSAAAICVPVRISVQDRVDPPANDAASGPDLAFVAPNNDTCAAQGTAVTLADANSFGTASVVIPAGSTSATFQVMALLDLIDEGATNERMQAQILAPVPGTGAGSVTLSAINRSTSVGIVNLNAERFFAVTASTANINEGDTVTFTVALTGSVPTEATTVVWTIGGDVDSEDYSGAASGMLSFTSISQQTVSVTTTDDMLNEEAETLSLTLSSATGGGGAGAGITMETASVTIGASDPLSITITGPTTITEGTAATADTAAIPARTMFTVDLGAEVRTATMVTITGAGGTPNPAMSPRDYGIEGSPVTIAAGSSSGTFTITTTDGGGAGTDNRALTITASSSGLTDATHAITIAEAVRRLTVTGPASVDETDANIGLTYTVTLSGDDFTAGSTVVTWSVSHAATAGTSDDDFTATSGTINFPGQSTFTVTVVGDNRDEVDEHFTVQLSVEDNRADGGTGFGPAAATTITDDEFLTVVTLSGPDNMNENSEAIFTVRLDALPSEPVTMNWAVSARMLPMSSAVKAAAADDFDGFGGTVFPNGMLTFAPSCPEDPPGNATPCTTDDEQTITIETSKGGETGSPVREFVLTISSITVGANTNLPVAPDSLRVTITEDAPSTRAQRLMTPVAAVAKNVSALAARAVSDRLRFTGANAFNIGGQSVSALSEDAKTAAAGAWAANPFEREQMLSAHSGGGSGTDMREILERSSFALTIGGADLNVWGSFGRMNASGDADGVAYDGDSSAVHIGADRVWRDGGLLGVSLARGTNETDFTVGNVKSTLETDLTSVHPYITRRFSEYAQLWATVGYGTGDADLREVDDSVSTTANWSTSINVLSAGVGLNMVPTAGMTLHVDTLLSRAELDAASNATGRALPKITAESMRVNAGVKLSRELANGMRPFLTLNLRRDFGDGDDGNAADYGGGLELNTDSLRLRIEGSKHFQGNGGDEERLSLTARHEAAGISGLAPYARWDLDGTAAGARLERGRFSVGMEVGSASGLENLLRGEWRF